jgi:hypothetical protein
VHSHPDGNYLVVIVEREPESELKDEPGTLPANKVFASTFVIASAIFS